MYKTFTRRLFEESLEEVAGNIKGFVLDIGAKDNVYKNQMNCDTYLTLDLIYSPGIDIIADAHKLPFKLNKFDWVLCTNLLEHVKDPKKIVAEARGVLKLGGKILIYVPFYYRYHPDPKDFYRFTEDGVRELLKDFDQIKIKKIGGVIVVVLEIFSIELAILQPIFEILWKFTKPLDRSLRKNRYYALGWFAIGLKKKDDK